MHLGCTTKSFKSHFDILCYAISSWHCMTTRRRQDQIGRGETRRKMSSGLTISIAEPGSDSCSAAAARMASRSGALVLDQDKVDLYGFFPLVTPVKLVTCAYCKKSIMVRRRFFLPSASINLLVLSCRPHSSARISRSAHPVMRRKPLPRASPPRCVLVILSVCPCAVCKVPHRRQLGSRPGHEE